MPGVLFFAMITPPSNCWNTAPLSRVPALRSPVKGFPSDDFWAAVAVAYLTASGPLNVTSTSSRPVMVTLVGAVPVGLWATVPEVASPLGAATDPTCDAADSPESSPPHAATISVTAHSPATTTADR